MKASDIRRLLQAVYKPVVADPEFKERLLRCLRKERYLQMRRLNS